MEENKTTSENKLSYEKLEQIALQLQQRLAQSEAKLNAINYGTMRLNYLFGVLDRAAYFPEQFIKDSADEIVKLLTISNTEVGEETTEE